MAHGLALQLEEMLRGDQCPRDGSRESQEMTNRFAVKKRLASSEIIIIINAWRQLISNPKKSNSDFFKLLRRTLLFILSSHWHEQNGSLKTQLLQSLVFCQGTFAIERSYEICKNVATVAQFPWRNDFFQWEALLNGQLTYMDTQVQEYLESEVEEVITARAHSLYVSHLTDFAMSLVVCAFKYYSRIATGSFCKSKKSRQELNLTSKRNERGYSTLEWFIFLLKRKIFKEIINDLRQFSCHEGIEIINRLKKNSQTVPLAYSSIQVFILNDLINPSQYCCTKELFIMWCELLKEMRYEQKELTENVQKILAGYAPTSAHFYLFCDVLWEKFGTKYLSLHTELYIRGLTSDINHLEVMRNSDLPGDVKSLENHIAAVFEKLSTLFSRSHEEVARECLFSAFSLQPTPFRLNSLTRGLLSSNDSSGKECSCGFQCTGTCKSITKTSTVFHPLLTRGIRNVPYYIVRDLVCVLESVRCINFQYNIFDWDKNGLVLKEYFHSYVRKHKIALLPLNDCDTSSETKIAGLSGHENIGNIAKVMSSDSVCNVANHSPVLLKRKSKSGSPKEVFCLDIGANIEVGSDANVNKKLKTYKKSTAGKHRKDTKTLPETLKTVATPKMAALAEASVNQSSNQTVHPFLLSECSKSQHCSQDSNSNTSSKMQSKLETPINLKSKFYGKISQSEPLNSSSDSFQSQDRVTSPCATSLSKLNSNSYIVFKKHFTNQLAEPPKTQLQNALLNVKETSQSSNQEALNLSLNGKYARSQERENTNASGTQLDVSKVRISTADLQLGNSVSNSSRPASNTSEMTEMYSAGNSLSSLSMVNASRTHNPAQNQFISNDSGASNSSINTELLQNSSFASCDDNGLQLSHLDRNSVIVQHSTQSQSAFEERYLNLDLKTSKVTPLASSKRTVQPHNPSKQTASSHAFNILALQPLESAKNQRYSPKSRPRLSPSNITSSKPYPVVSSNQNTTIQDRLVFDANTHTSEAVSRGKKLVWTGHLKKHGKVEYVKNTTVQGNIPGKQDGKKMSSQNNAAVSHKSSFHHVIEKDNNMQNVTAVMQGNVNVRASISACNNQSTPISQMLDQRISAQTFEMNKNCAANEMALAHTNNILNGQSGIPVQQFLFPNQQKTFMQSFNRNSSNCNVQVYNSRSPVFNKKKTVTNSEQINSRQASNDRSLIGSSQPWYSAPYPKQAPHVQENCDVPAYTNSVNEYMNLPVTSKSSGSTPGQSVPTMHMLSFQNSNVTHSSVKSYSKSHPPKPSNVLLQDNGILKNRLTRTPNHQGDARIMNPVLTSKTTPFAGPPFLIRHSHQTSSMVSVLPNQSFGVTSRNFEAPIYSHPQNQINQNYPLLPHQLPNVPVSSSSGNLMSPSLSKTPVSTNSRSLLAHSLSKAPVSTSSGINLCYSAPETSPYNTCSANGIVPQPKEAVPEDVGLPDGSYTLPNNMIFSPIKQTELDKATQNSWWVTEDGLKWNPSSENNLLWQRLLASSQYGQHFPPFFPTASSSDDHDRWANQAIPNLSSFNNWDAQAEANWKSIVEASPQNLVTQLNHKSNNDSKVMDFSLTKDSTMPQNLVTQVKEKSLVSNEDKSIPRNADEAHIDENFNSSLKNSHCLDCNSDFCADNSHCKILNELCKDLPSLFESSDHFSNDPDGLQNGLTDSERNMELNHQEVVAFATILDNLKNNNMRPQNIDSENGYHDIPTPCINPSVDGNHLSLSVDVRKKLGYFNGEKENEALSIVPINVSKASNAKDVVPFCNEFPANLTCGNHIQNRNSSAPGGSNNCDVFDFRENSNEAINLALTQPNLESSSPVSSQPQRNLNFSVQSLAISDNKNDEQQSMCPVNSKTSKKQVEKEKVECPICKKKLIHIKRHMKAMHPEYVETANEKVLTSDIEKEAFAPPEPVAELKYVKDNAASVNCDVDSTADLSVCVSVSTSIRYSCNEKNQGQIIEVRNNEPLKEGDPTLEFHSQVDQGEENGSVPAFEQLIKNGKSNAPKAICSLPNENVKTGSRKKSKRISLECSVCHKTLSSLKYLQRHLRLKHHILLEDDQQISHSLTNGALMQQNYPAQQDSENSLRSDILPNIISQTSGKMVKKPNFLGSYPLSPRKEETIHNVENGSSIVENSFELRCPSSDSSNLPLVEPPGSEEQNDKPIDCRKRIGRDRMIGQFTVPAKVSKNSHNNSQFRCDVLQLQQEKNLNQVHEMDFTKTQNETEITGNEMIQNCDVLCDEQLCVSEQNCANSSSIKTVPSHSQLASFANNLNGSDRLNEAANPDCFKSRDEMPEALCSDSSPNAELISNNGRESVIKSINLNISYSPDFYNNSSIKNISKANNQRSEILAGNLKFPNPVKHINEICENGRLKANVLFSQYGECMEPHIDADVSENQNAQNHSNVGSVKMMHDIHKKTSKMWAKVCDEINSKIESEKQCDNGTKQDRFFPSGEANKVILQNETENRLDDEKTDEIDLFNSQTEINKMNPQNENGAHFLQNTVDQKRTRVESLHKKNIEISSLYQPDFIAPHNINKVVSQNERGKIYLENVDRIDKMNLDQKEVDQISYREKVIEVSLQHEVDQISIQEKFVKKSCTDDSDISFQYELDDISSAEDADDNNLQKLDDISSINDIGQISSAESLVNISTQELDDSSPVNDTFKISSAEEAVDERPQELDDVSPINDIGHISATEDDDTQELNVISPINDIDQISSAEKNSSQELDDISPVNDTFKISSAEEAVDERPQELDDISPITDIGHISATEDDDTQELDVISPINDIDQISFADNAVGSSSPQELDDISPINDIGHICSVEYAVDNNSQELDDINPINDIDQISSAVDDMSCQDDIHPNPDIDQISSAEDVNSMCSQELDISPINDIDQISSAEDPVDNSSQELNDVNLINDIDQISTPKNVDDMSTQELNISSNNDSENISSANVADKPHVKLSEIPQEDINKIYSQEELTDFNDELTDVNDELTDVNDELTDVNDESTDVSEESTDVNEELIDVSEELTDDNEKLANVSEEVNDVSKENFNEVCTQELESISSQSEVLQMRSLEEFKDLKSQECNCCLSSKIGNSSSEKPKIFERIGIEIKKINRQKEVKKFNGQEKIDEIQKKIEKLEVDDKIGTINHTIDLVKNSGEKIYYQQELEGKNPFSDTENLNIGSNTEKIHHQEELIEIFPQNEIDHLSPEEEINESVPKKEIEVKLQQKIYKFIQLSSDKFNIKKLDVNVGAKPPKVVNYISNDIRLDDSFAVGVSEAIRLADFDKAFLVLEKRNSCQGNLKEQCLRDKDYYTKSNIETLSTKDQLFVDLPNQNDEQESGRQFKLQRSDTERDVQKLNCGGQGSETQSNNVIEDCVKKEPPIEYLANMLQTGKQGIKEIDGLNGNNNDVPGNDMLDTSINVIGLETKRGTATQVHKTIMPKEKCVACKEDQQCYCPKNEGDQCDQLEKKKQDRFLEDALHFFSSSGLPLEENKCYVENTIVERQRVMFEKELHCDQPGLKHGDLIKGHLLSNQLKDIQSHFLGDLYSKHLNEKHNGSREDLQIDNCDHLKRPSDLLEAYMHSEQLQEKQSGSHDEDLYSNQLNEKQRGSLKGSGQLMDNQSDSLKEYLETHQIQEKQVGSVENYCFDQLVKGQKNSPENCYSNEIEEEQSDLFEEDLHSNQLEHLQSDLVDENVHSDQLDEGQESFLEDFLSEQLEKVIDSFKDSHFDKLKETHLLEEDLRFDQIEDKQSVSENLEEEHGDCFEDLPSDQIEEQSVSENLEEEHGDCFEDLPSDQIEEQSVSEKLEEGHRDCFENMPSDQIEEQSVSENLEEGHRDSFEDLPPDQIEEQSVSEKLEEGHRDSFEDLPPDQIEEQSVSEKLEEGHRDSFEDLPPDQIEEQSVSEKLEEGHRNSFEDLPLYQIEEQSVSGNLEERHKACFEDLSSDKIQEKQSVSEKLKEGQCDCLEDLHSDMIEKEQSVFEKLEEGHRDCCKDRPTDQIEKKPNGSEKLVEEHFDCFEDFPSNQIQERQTGSFGDLHIDQLERHSTTSDDCHSDQFEVRQSDMLEKNLCSGQLNRHNCSLEKVLHSGHLSGKKSETLEGLCSDQLDQQSGSLEFHGNYLKKQEWLLLNKGKQCLVQSKENEFEDNSKTILQSRLGIEVEDKVDARFVKDDSKDIDIRQEFEQELVNKSCVYLQFSENRKNYLLSKCATVKEKSEDVECSLPKESCCGRKLDDLKNVAEKDLLKAEESKGYGSPNTVDCLEREDAKRKLLKTEEVIITEKSSVEKHVDRDETSYSRECNSQHELEKGDFKDIKMKSLEIKEELNKDGDINAVSDGKYDAGSSVMGTQKIITFPKNNVKEIIKIASSEKNKFFSLPVKQIENGTKEKFRNTSDCEIKYKKNQLTSKAKPEDICEEAVFAFYSIDANRSSLSHKQQRPNLIAVSLNSSNLSESSTAEKQSPEDLVSSRRTGLLAIHNPLNLGTISSGPAPSKVQVSLKRQIASKTESNISKKQSLNVPSKSIQCPECHKALSSKSVLYRHLRQVHKINPGVEGKQRTVNHQVNSSSHVSGTKLLSGAFDTNSQSHSPLPKNRALKRNSHEVSLNSMISNLKQVPPNASSFGLDTSCKRLPADKICKFHKLFDCPKAAKGDDPLSFKKNACDNLTFDDVSQKKEEVAQVHTSSQLSATIQAPSSDRCSYKHCDKSPSSGDVFENHPYVHTIRSLLMRTNFSGDSVGETHLNSRENRVDQYQLCPDSSSADSDSISSFTLQKTVKLISPKYTILNSNTSQEGGSLSGRSASNGTKIPTLRVRVDFAAPIKDESPLISSSEDSVGTRPTSAQHQPVSDFDERTSSTHHHQSKNGRKAPAKKNGVPRQRKSPGRLNDCDRERDNANSENLLKRKCSASKSLKIVRRGRGRPRKIPQIKQPIRSKRIYTRRIFKTPRTISKFLNEDSRTSRPKVLLQRLKIPISKIKIGKTFNINDLNL